MAALSAALAPELLREAEELVMTELCIRLNLTQLAIEQLRQL
ncbi:MAG: hypothetical protein NTV22_01580 [bacterium]|nr:hypothetical protein [bacterium]